MNIYIYIHINMNIYKYIYMYMYIRLTPQAPNWNVGERRGRSPLCIVIDFVHQP